MLPHNFHFCSFTESLKITNKSKLPFSVALKLEGEFCLLPTHEQKVKFDLKVKESRDILMSFNSALIKEANTNRSYHGRIKVYSLGKLQNVVELQANVIHPSVELSSCELNIVNNMLPRAFTFVITNRGSIDASFELKFKETSSSITKIHERKQEKLLNIAQCLMKQKCNLKDTFFMLDSGEQEVQNLIKELEDFDAGDEKNEHTEAEDTKPKMKTKIREQKPVEDLYDINEYLNQSENEEASLGEIQKYFKRLLRGVSETLVNKELEEEKLKTTRYVSEESAESYLQLSQSEGLLKPGECRTISIYFVGSRNGE